MTLPVGAQMLITFLALALIAGLAFWAAHTMEEAEIQEVEAEVSLLDL